MPRCRLIYLMFLTNFSAFPMAVSGKPINGLSRFPNLCTDMFISFAGENSLITENLQNFGDNTSNNEISKKIFFDYLTSNRMFSGTFDQFFCAEDTSKSLIQILPLDVKHLDSIETERLTLKMQFNKGTPSPANQVILCLSVHTNGRAICSADPKVSDWKWEFKTL